MSKLRHIFEKAVEPRNAAALGIAGALIFSAAFANASFFATAADSGVDTAANTGGFTNGGFTTGTVTAGGTQGTFFSTADTLGTQTGVLNTNNNTFTGTSFFNTGNNFPTNTQTSFSNIRVMAIGDGITQGIGANTGSDFVSLLGQAEGVQILNAAGSGLTTAQVLQGLDSALATYHPQVVILMLGANDAAQGVSGQTEFSNLQQIVQRIQASGARVVIVGDYAATFDTTYEAAYAQLASITNSYYVPNALQNILGNSTLLADSTHPNSQGHLLLAQRIDPVFRTALQAAAQNNGNGGGIFNGGNSTTTPNALQVSCTAIPSSVAIGQTMVWRAYINGTSATSSSYSYQWSGTDGLNNRGRQLTGYYATPGTKTAMVNVVASNGLRGSATCSVNITQTPDLGACFYPNSNIVNQRYAAYGASNSLQMNALSAPQANFQGSN